MLDRFERSDLDGLVAHEGGVHLSIYMPTHSAAIDTEQDVLRLKNLLQQSEKALAEGWMRSTEVRDFLVPITPLIHDESFWSKRQNGLAIFLASQDFHIFRLGIPFKEQLSISREYRIRPIVPALDQDGRGWLLTLSEKKIGLYRVENDLLQPVKVPNLPQNLEETLNYTSVERGQLAHTGSAAHGGKRSEVFHGQGGKPDTHRDDLQHFLRAVDDAVTVAIGDSKDPLILAGVESAVAIYREISSCKHLSDEHISGNADYSEARELYRKVRAVLDRLAGKKRVALAERIGGHLNTPRASAKPSEAIRGAFQGRIETLFFDKEVTLQGQFDPVLQSAIVYEDQSNVEFSPYNTDLIESTVRETLKHRGDVYAVSQPEMPVEAAMAALFRF